MKQRIYYFPELKNRTETELKQFERMNRKKAEVLHKEADLRKADADKFLMELNYRRIPEAQEMAREISKIKHEISRHREGMLRLSRTRLDKLAQALKATESHLQNLLMSQKLGR